MPETMSVAPEPTTSSPTVYAVAREILEGLMLDEEALPYLLAKLEKVERKTRVDTQLAFRDGH